MIKEEYTFNHGALLQEFESKCETEGLLLIAPGGGYFTLTDNEGACVAERFAKEGFRCFVLHYATVDTRSPCGADIALKDMSAAIRLIREKDAESPLFLLGFSAGGHLCASFANTWKTEEERCGLPLGTLKPSGTVLCYPALSFAKIFQLHEDVNLPENMRQKINDFQKLICKGLGVREDVNLNPHEYDVIPHVNENTPPSFVWGQWRMN